MMFSNSSRAFALPFFTILEHCYRAVSGWFSRPTNQMQNTSSHLTIPGARVPGYSLFPCVFPCFLSPGEVQQAGVGISFWVSTLGKLNL